MADRIIQTADLSGIKNRLDLLQGYIATVDTHVATVDSNVTDIASELDNLIAEFHAFVQQQELRNREQIAETRVVKLRQELNKKFGHYDVVRRTATGILQATDLGIIRQEIINNATEDMMIKTPNYWLAPCLVALSAWIADKKELAEKAVREALARDDEKTSLFFSLVCRRADRKIACMKWVNRYLENQNEEQLDNNTIIVLSAYANGLWGTDTEGIVARTISKWIEDLKSKPQAVQQQQQQWMKAIKLKEPNPAQHLNYPYLQKYSPTWGAIQQMIAGAYLHQSLLQYFQNIFVQQNSTRALKQNLDAILDKLVTDFDDEEVPLRQKVQLEQLVIDFHGNEAEAKKHMEVQKTAFATHKDFIQLLTDASMNPELAHADAATQKFAIALSKDWILGAYQNVIAQNRSQVPTTIELVLGYDFKVKTQNGENEQEILTAWDQYIEGEKKKSLQAGELTNFGKLCKTLRWLLVIIGVLCLFAGIWGFVIAVFLGIAAVYCQDNYSKQKKRYEQAQQNVQQLEEVSRPNGQQMLRAMLAEVVDLRSDYAEQEAKAEKTIDFIKGLKANQFTLSHADGTRRMNIQKE